MIFINTDNNIQKHLPCHAPYKLSITSTILLDQQTFEHSNNVVNYVQVCPFTPSQCLVRLKQWPENCLNRIEHGGNGKGCDDYCNILEQTCAPFAPKELSKHYLSRLCGATANENCPGCLADVVLFITLHRLSIRRLH